MPDADDFDIEYFRKLLKGNSDQDNWSKPANKIVSPEKGKLRHTAKPAASTGRDKPTDARKKGRSRHHE